MKNAIVTRANDNIKSMCDITHPILKLYADECCAEFIVLDKDKGLHPHYRILQIYDLFEVYDRILVIDSDVIVTTKCKNIFDIVPYNMIGTIYEDVGSRKDDRRRRIQKVQKERGYVDWSRGYINTGVILFSNIHRNIFNIDHNSLYMDLGFDDIELGYQIHKYGYKIYELPCEFNFMSMFTEEWNGFKSKADAYIIHYAGQGHCRYIQDRTEQIKQDLLLFKKYGLV